VQYASDPSRYGLFEFAGAVSEWELEIPGDRLFDWSTISDFTITLAVTHDRLARREPTRRRAPLMVSLRDNFAAEFSRLLDVGGPVPIGVQTLLGDVDGQYKAGAGEARVCVLSRAAIASTATPQIEVRKSDKDASPISAPSAVFEPSKPDRQQVRLSSRELTEAEVEALVEGAFVSLVAKQFEVVDVVLLLPPKKGLNQ